MSSTSTADMPPNFTPPSCLSLCWLTVRGAHPLDHIAAAAEAGFNAVGLRLVPPTPGDPLIPLIGDEPLVRDVLASLADRQISVLDVETVWIGPDIDIVALRPAFELAQRLGCRNLLTMGNDSEASRLTSNFARLCEEAARFGLDVGMEFSAYSAVKSIQHAERLVRAAARPNGRILVDALHLARSGGSPADVAALDRGLLAYCQLADARGPTPTTDDALRDEARGGRYLPGEGDLPLQALLAVLPPGLPMGVEAPTARDADLSVADRARLAAVATRKFFQTVRIQREASPES